MQTLQHPALELGLAPGSRLGAGLGLFAIRTVDAPIRIAPIRIAAIRIAPIRITAVRGAPTVVAAIGGDLIGIGVRFSPIAVPINRSDRVRNFLAG